MLLKCYKNAFFREKSAEIFVGMKKKQYLCTLFRRAYGHMHTQVPYIKRERARKINKNN